MDFVEMSSKEDLAYDKDRQVHIENTGSKKCKNNQKKQSDHTSSKIVTLNCHKDHIFHYGCFENFVFMASDFQRIVCPICRASVVNTAEIE